MSPQVEEKWFGVLDKLESVVGFLRSSGVELDGLHDRLSGYYEDSLGGDVVPVESFEGVERGIGKFLDGIEDRLDDLGDVLDMVVELAGEE